MFLFLHDIHQKMAIIKFYLIIAVFSLYLKLYIFLHFAYAITERMVLIYESRRSDLLLPECHQWHDQKCR